MQNSTIFLDGRLIKVNERFIESISPGIVKGKGVFETMSLIRGEPFALKNHIDRMFRGLRLLKLSRPFSPKKARECIYQLLELNNFKNARVRLTVWKDDFSLRSSIICQPLRPFPENKYKQGFKAVVSKTRLSRTRLSHIKSLDYHVYREASLEAKSKGCDEAILLNSSRELVEGSRTNIFFLKKNVLFTPPVRCGCLNGITRQIVIKCVRKLGIPYAVIASGVNQLSSADESFLTNSLIGVMPLTMLDGQFIGKGRAGTITLRILDAYRKKVREFLSQCP
jgi:branched-chain amino acid aminotransferase